jgi:hypothetical protein
MIRLINPSSRLLAIFFVFIGGCLLFPEGAKAENFWRLNVEGRLLDQFDNHALNTGIIQVYRNGSRLHLITTGKEGQFAFELDREGDYTLICSKPGYFDKKIGLSTKGVSSFERAKVGDMNSNYKCDVVVTLFREVKGVDVSVLKELIGNIFFNPQKNNFSFDVNEELESRLEALTKKIDDVIQVNEKIKEQVEKSAKMNSVMTEAMAKAKERQNNLKNAHLGSDVVKKKDPLTKSADGTGISRTSDIDPTEAMVKTEVTGGARCTITKTRVSFRDRVTEFREIRYNWGAVYYKKNDADITDLNYKQYMRLYNVK